MIVPTNPPLNTSSFKMPIENQKKEMKNIEDSAKKKYSFFMC